MPRSLRGSGDSAHAHPTALESRACAVVVLGDSFTYGSGLRYADTWVTSSSEMIRNEMLGTPLDRHSRLVEFVLNRVNHSIVRRSKLADLTSLDVFQRPRFRQNFPAIPALRRAAAERGARFRVAISRC